jgi:hypothetical protein
MLRVILLALTIGALAPASAQALTMGPLDFPAEGQRLETGLGEYVIVFSYAVADVTGCGPIVDGETGVEIDAPEMTTFPTALRSPGNYEVFEVLNPASGTLPRTVRWRSYAVCNPPDPNPDDDNEPEALTAYSPWRTLRLECRPGSVWDILYCGKPIPGPDPEPEPSPEPLPEPAPTPVASTNPFAEEDKRTARHISLDIAAFQATMDRCSLTYGAIAIIPKFKKYPKLKLPDWLPDLDPISAGAGIGATICQFAKASVADLKLAWDKVAVDPPDLEAVSELR